jgi:hypothetical protein
MVGRSFGLDAATSGKIGRSLDLEAGSARTVGVLAVVGLAVVELARPHVVEFFEERLESPNGEPDLGGRAGGH